MIEKHKILVEDYNNTKKNIGKYQALSLIFEIFIILIVCGMKTIQKTVSLEYNLLANGCVGLLFFIYLWVMRPKHVLYKKLTDIMIDGNLIEKQNFTLKLSFFTKKIKHLDIWGTFLSRLIFDLIIVYFFSISITQTMKIINPDILLKIQLTKIMSTIVIDIYLFYLYYQPLKGLAKTKKEIAISCK